MVKSFVSPRKLDALPEESIVEFENDKYWWRKHDGQWLVPGFGILFDAKSLSNYHNGRPFTVRREGPHGSGRVSS